MPGGAGLYDGFRLSEWAQPNAHAPVNNPQLNSRGDPMAFCLDDVRFLSDDEIRIPHHRILKLDLRSPVVGRDFVRIRTQKNGENGEERQHTRNLNTSAPCHITSMMRVVQRFDRLLGLRHNVSLSVYRPYIRHSSKYHCLDHRVHVPHGCRTSLQVRPGEGQRTPTQMVGTLASSWSLRYLAWDGLYQYPNTVSPSLEIRRVFCVPSQHRRTCTPTEPRPFMCAAFHLSKYLQSSKYILFRRYSARY
jgi:hypothetical protein